jgi:hypothetical protein
VIDNSLKTVKMVFVWLSLLMNKNHDFLYCCVVENKMIAQCLRVSFLKNPYETSLVLYGIPRGLKGLLHMAIVSPMKRTYVICFVCVFCFVLLRD